MRKSMHRRIGIPALLLAGVFSAGADVELPPRPDAVIDLMSAAAVSEIRGRWSYVDAEIIEVDHRAPGADLKASGAPTRTHDLRPRPDMPDFNAAAWVDIAPERLMDRRTTGKLAFGWYRLRFTVPERFGKIASAGAEIAFEIVVDDYAEIWVNGRLRTVPGQAGGALVAGWNTPNRVLLTGAAQPGESFDLCVLAANGPLSAPPDNFCWIRSATLDVVQRGGAPRFESVPLEVLRADPRLDEIVPPGARLEKLAGGFDFIEGPVWIPDGPGYLLFSEPNRNLILRWAPESGTSIYRTKSGYAGVDIGEYGQPGSNGLALDREGRLTICEHGNRRVTRLEPNGVLTVLAERYDGRRLNSPNDCVYRSDGTLLFTDPAFGLPKWAEDPRRELPITGVYALRDGIVTLISDELSGPNGLAFSPDERFLYVGNWDEKRKVVMRYELTPACAVVGRSVFFDLTDAPGEEAIDGVKVDARGNVYISGPGGVWIVAADGRHLGTLRGPELPANFNFGDADGKTLYLTARHGLYRLRLAVAGARSSPLGAAPAGAARR